MILRIFVGLFLTAMAAGTLAEPAPAARSNASQNSPAMRLSLLVNPDTQILELSDRAFAAGFKESLAKGKETAALLEEHPKLLDAIMDRAVPVVRKHVAASLPELQAAAARFYAEKFTEAEIGQLLEFYGSPTGAKFIAGTYAGLDMGKVADAMGADGTKAVPAELLRGVTASAAVGVLPDLDDQDWERFIAFTGTPVFAKLRTVSPEMLKLMADIANKPNPALDREIEQVVGQVAEEYFAKMDAPDSGD